MRKNMLENLSLGIVFATLTMLSFMGLHYGATHNQNPDSYPESYINVIESQPVANFN